MEKKPGLAILIGQALASKNKMKDGEKSDSDEHMERLKEIAADLLDAIKSDDVDAVAELLCEAFECCDAMPHMEGPHEDSEY